MQLEGQSVANTAKALGFSHPMQFLRYRKAYPDFENRFESARDMSCEILEDKILTVIEDTETPHEARVRLDALCKALSFKNPSRYGQRIDLSITQTVDIGSSLSRMQQSLDATYRNVTEIAAPQKPNDSDELW